MASSGPCLPLPTARGPITAPRAASPYHSTAGPVSSSPQPCLASAHPREVPDGWGCPCPPACPAPGWGEGTDPGCQALPCCPHGGPQLLRPALLDPDTSKAMGSQAVLYQKQLQVSLSHAAMPQYLVAGRVSVLPDHRVFWMFASRQAFCILLCCTFYQRSGASPVFSFPRFANVGNLPTLPNLPVFIAFYQLSVNILKEGTSSTAWNMEAP